MRLEDDPGRQPHEPGGLRASVGPAGHPVAVGRSIGSAANPTSCAAILGIDLDERHSGRAIRRAEPMRYRLSRGVEATMPDPTRLPIFPPYHPGKGRFWASRPVGGPGFA